MAVKEVPTWDCRHRLPQRLRKALAKREEVASEQPRIKDRLRRTLSKAFCTAVRINHQLHDEVWQYLHEHVPARLRLGHRRPNKMLLTTETPRIEHWIWKELEELVDS